MPGLGVHLLQLKAASKFKTITPRFELVLWTKLGICDCLIWTRHYLLHSGTVEIRVSRIHDVSGRATDSTIRA